MKWKTLALAVGLFPLAGCMISSIPTGPTQYESHAIEADTSNLLDVNLTMGAGDLKVGSGTQKFMQGYFTYNVPAFKPDVRYSSSGGVGNLTIEQPGKVHTHAGNVKYEWDLRFTENIPIDFSVRFGAGEAQLDLGSLDLRNVNIEMGVGQLHMDLRGHPKNSYNVHIRGGVGEAVVRLPSGVGLYADAAGGIGEIQVRGLRKRDNHWENDAYASAPVKIRIDAQGGIGSIRLEADTE
jgi:hypothetical protein